MCLQDLVCNNEDKICLVLVGTGCVVTVLLFIITILFMVITCLMAKGIRHLIQHTSTSAVAIGQSSNEQNQHQQQQQLPQNQGMYSLLDYSLKLITEADNILKWWRHLFNQATVYSPSNIGGDVKPMVPEIYYTYTHIILLYTIVKFVLGFCLVLYCLVQSLPNLIQMYVCDYLH